MINFNLDIYELKLEKKSLCALNRNGIYTIKQLVALSHEDLLNMPRVGEKIRADIMDKLKKQELHLGIK